MSDLIKPATAAELQSAHFRSLQTRIERHIARVKANLESLEMQLAAVNTTLESLKGKK